MKSEVFHGVLLLGHGGVVRISLVYSLKKSTWRADAGCRLCWYFRFASGRALAQSSTSAGRPSSFLFPLNYHRLLFDDWLRDVRRRWRLLSGPAQNCHCGQKDCRHATIVGASIGRRWKPHVLFKFLLQKRMQDSVRTTVVRNNRIVFPIELVAPKWLLISGLKLAAE